MVTNCGVFVAPGASIRICPVYAPAARLAAAALTCTIGGLAALAALDPEGGDAESHVPPTAVAVQFMLPPPLLRTANVCGGAAPPFEIPVKVNPVWLSRIVGAAGVTNRFTVTVVLVPVVELEMTIAAEYTPGERPAGFAVI